MILRIHGLVSDFAVTLMMKYPAVVYDEEDYGYMYYGTYSLWSDWKCSENRLGIMAGLEIGNFEF